MDVLYMNYVMILIMGGTIIGYVMRVFAIPQFGWFMNMAVLLVVLLRPLNTAEMGRATMEKPAARVRKIAEPARSTTLPRFRSRVPPPEAPRTPPAPIFP